jgi:hypothetical protein
MNVQALHGELLWLIATTARYATSDMQLAYRDASQICVRTFHW